MRFLSLHLFHWVAAGLGVAAAAFFLGFWRRRSAIRSLSALGGLVSNASPVRRLVRNAALIAACMLAAVTILRPITGTVVTEHQLPARDLVLLVDVSKSMAAVDAGGLSRLEAAKLYARELLRVRPADRIG